MSHDCIGYIYFFIYFKIIFFSFIIVWCIPTHDIRMHGRHLINQVYTINALFDIYRIIYTTRSRSRHGQVSNIRNSLIPDS